MSIAEYRIRIAEDTQVHDGTLWIRDQREWELEADDVRVAVADNDSPYAHFDGLVDALRDQSMHLHTCGTCKFFRKYDDDAGWNGACTWHSKEAAAATDKTVSLLSPSCHRFDYHAGPIEVVEREIDDMPAVSRQNGRSHSNRKRTQSFNPIAVVKRLLGRQPKMPRVEAAERSGSQPCPCCGASMRNRGFVSNVDDTGEERVFSIWRCPECGSDYVDDYREAYVGSRARDAERLYVVPPAEAAKGAAMAAKCPRPYTKGCTCVANQWFDAYGAELAERGRQIAHRESVVWL